MLSLCCLLHRSASSFLSYCWPVFGCTESQVNVGPSPSLIYMKTHLQVEQDERREELELILREICSS